MEHDEIYRRLGAAAVRGYALRRGCALPERLSSAPLCELCEQELEDILETGAEWGVKLYRFKRGHESLPRVKSVLGFLRGINPESILDVGSGRGVFLFPFLDAFPETEVTSLDILDYRVEFLDDIRRGGVTRLTPLQADICGNPCAPGSADVVTMLEVLEHIPDVGAAVRASVDTARRYVVVSVPSHPDSNPEHIRLLTKDLLTELFCAAGCKRERLHFSGVPGHLILVASVSAEE